MRGKIVSYVSGIKHETSISGSRRSVIIRKEKSLAESTDTAEKGPPRLKRFRLKAVRQNC